jgi:hypothetical protein
VAVSAASAGRAVPPRPASTASSAAADTARLACAAAAASGRAAMAAATACAWAAIVRSRPPGWRKSKPTKKTPSSGPPPTTWRGSPLASTGTGVPGNSASTPGR